MAMCLLPKIEVAVPERARGRPFHLRHLPTLLATAHLPLRTFTYQPDVTSLTAQIDPQPYTLRYLLCIYSAVSVSATASTAQKNSNPAHYLPRRSGNARSRACLSHGLRLTEGLLQLLPTAEPQSLWRRFQAATSSASLVPTSTKLSSSRLRT